MLMFSRLMTVVGLLALLASIECHNCGTSWRFSHGFAALKQDGSVATGCLLYIATVSPAAGRISRGTGWSRLDQVGLPPIRPRSRDLVGGPCARVPSSISRRRGGEPRRSLRQFECLRLADPRLSIHQNRNRSRVPR